MVVKTHKDLDVWHASIVLAEDIYRLSSSFPKEEVYGITSQVRRAVVSIASNIAEGAARSTNKDFVHFLYIAAGSASELDTQLEIAQRLGMGEPGSIVDAREKLESVSKMLQGLIRSVRSRLQ